MLDITEFLGSVYAMPPVFEAGMEAMSIPSHLPKEVNGQPVHYRWRKVMKDGILVHPTKKYGMLITPEKRMSWERNYRMMQADGVPIPVVKDHKAGSDATLGYVYDVRQNGEWWEELHGYIGDNALDVASKNYLSTGWRGMNIAGNGKAYGEGIFHCATTPYPVQTGQPIEFQASSDTSFVTLQQLAYSETEETLMSISFANPADLDSLSALLGTTGDIDGASLLASVTALKAKAESVPTEKIVEVLASSFVADEVAEARGETFNEKLTALVEKGKVPPAVASKLKPIGELLGSFKPEFLASAEVGGVSSDDRLDKVLLAALAELPDVVEASAVVQAPPADEETSEQRQIRLGDEMANRFRKDISASK